VIRSNIFFIQLDLQYCHIDINRQGSPPVPQVPQAVLIKNVKGNALLNSVI